MNPDLAKPAFEEPESARREVCRLASLVLDGVETDDDHRRLEMLLARSAELRQLYYRTVSLHSQLAWALIETGSPPDQVQPGAAGGRTGEPVIAAHARDRASSPVLGFLAAVIDHSTVWLTSSKVLALAVAGSLATYFVVLMVSLALTPGSRDPQESAGPSGTAAAAAKGRPAAPSGKDGSLAVDDRPQWSPTSPVPTGAALQVGRRYDLASGVAHVALARGTQLAIEGPAVWQVASDEHLQLDAGKLVARVPPRAVGFTVSTPTAEVVDLGTEFGIAVDQGGGTDLHVFKGSVELKPAQATETLAANSATAVRLGSGEARHITVGGRVSMLPSAATAAKFQRVLSPSAQSTAALDLVDLLSGGNGRGHRKNVSIDPRNCQYGDLELLITAMGDGAYHAAPQHPSLDGCFVPNGLTPVDSAGHQFDFPKTSAETCYHFWAGQKISWLNLPQRLGSVDYATAGHVCLFMNANKGLTLDLNAVRRSIQGKSIESLRATAGNSIPRDHLEQSRPGLLAKADLFVIVDGQLRFKRAGFSVDDAPFSLQVALTDNDRFLTLAATDGGDSFWGDWVTLGDPQLVLRPVP